MSLRDRFSDALKAAMRAGDTPRVSAMRMILAKLKETDIAARAKGVQQVAEEEIVAMLRAMVKSRRESVELYRRGNRPDLVAKEEAEIAVIESFLPPSMDETAIERAIAAAVAETGAQGIKDIGRVMAALKAKHATELDLSRVAPRVRAKLGG